MTVSAPLIVKGGVRAATYYTTVLYFGDGSICIIPIKLYYADGFIYIKQHDMYNLGTETV